MTEGKLEISFVHELYSQKEKVVHYKRPWMGGKRILYKNRVYTTGKDIDKIREVQYILHPTFPNPLRTVTNRNNGFELIFWAWGGFQMNILVTDTDGEVYDYTLPIRLGDILREAKGNTAVKWSDESIPVQSPL